MWHTIFLFYAALLVFDDSSPLIYPESVDRNEKLTTQLNGYMSHYAESGRAEGLLLTFQLLHTHNDTQALFMRELSRLAEQDQAVFDIDQCLQNKGSSLSLPLLFAACSQNPDVLLFAIQENRHHQSSVQILKQALLQQELDDRQQSFLSFLNNGTIPDAFFRDGPPDILDYAYILFAFRNQTQPKPYLDSHKTWQTVVSSFYETPHLDPDDILLLYSTMLMSMLQNDADYILQHSELFSHHFSSLPATLTSSFIISGVSNMAHQTGHFKIAVDFSRHVSLPFSAYLSKRHYVLNAINFSVFLSRFGNIQESLELLEYVYENRDLLDQERHLPYLLNNLALSYYQIGHFEQYIAFSHQAVELAETYERTDLQIDLLNNLFTHYLTLGHTGLAQQYLNRLKSINPSENEHYYAGKVHANLAYHYYKVENNDSLALAASYYALEHAKLSENDGLIQYIYTVLIHIYRESGFYDDALQYAELLHAIASKQNDHTGLKQSMIHMADILFKQGEQDKAFSLIDQITDNEAFVNVHLTNEGNLIRLTAIKRLSEGKTSHALSMMEDFLETRFEHLLHSSEMQSGYYYQFHTFEKELIRLLFDTLIQEKEYSRVLFWMDEIKNLTSANFFNNPALRSEVLSESDLIRDFALRNRIDRLRGLLIDAPSSEYLELQKQLQESISEQNRIRRKVLQFYEPEPFNLQTIREKMSRTDLILYFTVLDHTLYATLISRDDISIETIQLCDTISQKIEAIGKSIISYQPSLNDLAWFKALILDPLDIPKRFTNYYVIPDDFLYQIPLEILPVTSADGPYNYGEVTYLIEYVSVSYINSLKDLELAFTARPTQNVSIDFLGFGISDFKHESSQLESGRSMPPLPLAETEINEIEEKLTSFSSTLLFTSLDGTEKNFRDYASLSRVIHIASHSEVYEKDPLYSVIYLTPGDTDTPQTNDDGLLYAYELFSTRLSNDMVMLNSCESGSGNYIMGSGIIGLSRAFNYAGAQSLVLNMWTIRDKTAFDLSISFYHYLNEGLTKSKAMQKAKIDYMNNRNSNPANWGSFVIYGSDKPLVDAPHSKTRFAFIFVVLLCVVALVLYRVPGRLFRRKY